MLKRALLVTAGTVIGFGANAVLAQSNAPYYQVAEINVKDQTAYEASGVDKVRDGLKAQGGKLIAGGYNKATAIDGAPPANRVLIFQYPNKEASDKAWSDSIKPWQTSEQVRKVADFRTIGVEAVEQK
jgi:uncharacterized protein (DUF1330 family)